MDQQSHFHRPNVLISPLCNTVNRHLTPLPIYHWEFIIINPFCCYSVVSHVWFFVTPWTARVLCLLLSPRVCSNSYLLSWWHNLTILSSATPFSFAFSLSQHQSLFQWVSSLHQVVKVLEFQLQHQSLQRTLIYFRVDWFDLSEAQGALKNLLQHHKRVRVSVWLFGANTWIFQRFIQALFNF